MVVAGRGTVRIEIVPWLTEAFPGARGSRLVLEEELEAAVTLRELLRSLATKHPAIGKSIVDVDAGALFEHVDVIHNDTLIGAHAALDERIEPADSLVFFPAFSGG